MTPKTLWAGETARPCEQCAERTNVNFMLRQQPDDRWLCVVCIVHNHRASQH